MKRYFASLALVCLFSLVTATGIAADTTAKDAPVKLICPALKLHVRPEDPSGPGIDDFRLPELVLVVQKTNETNSGAKRPRERIDEIPHCTVKRVLYGSYTGKTIHFQWPGERVFWYWGEGEFIVALIPAFYKEQPEYTAFYGVPAVDEHAEAALCQACLDCAALASACIFVGKELSIEGQQRDETKAGEDSWNASTVEVVRVIHGTAIQPGEKVRVVDAGMVHITNYHRRAIPQPRIYFVSPSERAKGAKTVYQVYTHQSIDQEAKVNEALQHRNQCVFYEKEEDGHKSKCQEVVFHGTDAQAIDLLSATNDGAVSLVYRTLMHHRKLARPLVVAAIENEMFRMEPASDNKQAGFHRLGRLVDLLGDMEREDGGQDIERLIDKYISRIEQGLSQPPPSEAARYWENEYGRIDINRSLTWLLHQYGEHQSRQKYGERLLALRAKVGGRWRAEVQVALDAIKMEDSLELATAMTRMKGIQPVRSRLARADKSERTSHHDAHDGGPSHVFFTGDGKELRSYGDDNQVCTWNLATMEMRSHVEIPADLQVMSIREPDGQYAVCVNKDDSKRVCVWNVETGKITANIEVPANHLRWIDDHEAVMLDDTQICRFDYRQGKVLSKLRVESNFYLMNGIGELTEDHHSLFAIDIGDEGRPTWAVPTIIDLATGKTSRRERDNADRIRVNRAGLVPGGRYFYLADPNIYIYDRHTLKQVSRKVLDGIDILGLSFTGNGNRYALVSGGRIFIEDILKWCDPKTESIVRIHDTLSGKALLAFPASTRWVQVKFSPDGKRLAVVNDDGTIEIWTLPDKT